MTTTTTQHAGLTLRGVTPAELVDRRPIGIINCSRSEVWRGDTPYPWLREAVARRAFAGYQRVGLHQPGRSIHASGANPLAQHRVLNTMQREAIDRVVHEFPAMQWCVNTGGLGEGRITPREGWASPSYAHEFSREIVGWALALHGGGPVVVFADGMWNPDQHFRAALVLDIDAKIKCITADGQRPLVRVGAYIPDYGDGGRSRPDGGWTAPVRLTTLRHVKGAIERGRLDLDHLDFLTREQHLWLNGQQEDIELDDGNTGYREIDDPLVAEWADRGGIVSSMTADPEVVAVCKAMTERGAAAAIKLLEQREREEAAQQEMKMVARSGEEVPTVGVTISPDAVSQHVKGIEQAQSDALGDWSRIATIASGPLDEVKLNTTRQMEISVSITPEDARFLAEGALLDLGMDGMIRLNTEAAP